MFKGIAIRAMGVAAEEVEIVGGAENPIIDKTETKVTSTYTARELFNLPIGGSGMYAAMYLAPGVTGGLTGNFRPDYARIRGGTTGQTLYSINGIQVRDPELGRGQQDELIIDDLIQDVQVVQNPINAKYGFTSSGSVNITTKTGTNRFQGTFRVALSNGSWDSLNGVPVINRWSELESTASTAGNYNSTYVYNVPADEMSRTYSATISGPIWRDKITFSYGGKFQPQSLSGGNYQNMLNANPSLWRTYIPGFTALDPKYTGPNQLNPSAPPSAQWAGQFWGANPAASTEIFRDFGPNSTTFNQYKLYFQITPDHQLDVLYSRNLANSFMVNTETPDRSIRFGRTDDTYMKSFNYRGILGPNAVLSAQWGRNMTKVGTPIGPGDPIYYTTYQESPVAILAAGVSTGTTSYVTSGAVGGGSIKDSENWSIDLSYIWGPHNFDAGVQRLNERTTAGGYGINNRRFYVPAMNHEGLYMVYNPFHTDSPLNQPQTGAVLQSYGYPSIGFGSTNVTLAQAQATWKNAVLTGTSRMPVYIQSSGASNDWVPYDAQVTSLYINDNWTYNDHFAVNFGLRADQTVVTDTHGEIVSSLAINPRFRVQYDLLGDNRHVFSLSLTQQVGNLHRGAVMGFAGNNKTSVNRRYIWDKDNNENGMQPWQPHFVTKGEILDPANYGRYWSYSDTMMYMVIDKNLKPEQTTNLDLMYRRAFSDGGYFRASLVFGFLNRALYGEGRDVAIKLEDPNPPGGMQPNNGQDVSYAYMRYLYNRADRGRHHASAELEWKAPLVSKPTWRVEWAGNWTIAKTTGNFAYGGIVGRSSTEVSEQFVDEFAALGMARELLDPWGESNVTPRHRMRSWVTLSHGDVGGVINELTLFADWASFYYTSTSWSYRVPSDTFVNSSLNGGKVTNFPAAASVYPHGLGHRKTGSDAYSAHLTWNISIPVAGKLSTFINVMIGNVFNGISENFVSEQWVPGKDGAGMLWTRGMDPKSDPMWGLQVANRTSGPNWGLYYGNGARSFNGKLEFGFRF